MDDREIEEDLHEASDVEGLERRLTDRALAMTGARHGAIFLWDEDALAIRFHVVDTVVVTLPGARVREREGEPSGIALWVHRHNEPYLCNETRDDPHYARYFLDVRSIAAVPIPYQGRSIGVITVSADEPGAFTRDHLVQLGALARQSAKFLRRAQLFGKRDDAAGRPYLIKGLSSQWSEVERRLEHVSPTDAPVLIHGESGTGKELVAQAIHFNSQRAKKPLVTVNCAAIPDTMLESVLFGHLRGAFTGATFDKVGEFQKADGGTLFLDEVGELPVLLQSKVLRAVEQGEVAPLGSNKPAEKVDVRLLCATNRDLPAMVESGDFRGDLYYRLSVMTLELPPLRSYKDNLEVMAGVFLQQAAQRLNRKAPRISPAAMSALTGHDFPGNVRELKNVIEHAAIMATEGEVRVEHLPQNVQGTVVPPEPARPPAEPSLKELREQWLAPLERRYLIELLAKCEGNVAQAAKRAGINTVTMYRLLKKRGLKLRREVG